MTVTGRITRDGSASGDQHLGRLAWTMMASTPDLAQWRSASSTRTSSVSNVRTLIVAYPFMPLSLRYFMTSYNSS